MRIGDKVFGAARKIAGKMRYPSKKEEEVILGAEAIPNGCRFDTGKKQDAIIAPEKKPAMIG